MLTRRAVLLALGAAGASFTSLPSLSHAGQAVAISLEDLLRRSRRVAVATALGGECRWEVVGAHRRIVTYNRVWVDEPLDDEAGERELVVRTLGGRVGKIGQIVHGEAMLVRGTTSVLFLRELDSQTHRVTAMAQGHFPLHFDADRTPRLRASPHRGGLIDTPRSAARRLVGRSLTEAADLIREARRDAR